eukprot:CAMPEP_0198135958 /NCGR_PEP_ID=MMETSP1442-20131203/60864_1 /TAXON_ID= /ORGANISM="Craspedostauros australis, Strain CCMP3328" /LENGTH=260 /DNA_ID=CAMNT_0043797151 /DNA_START=28 /DNA_END=810 /DNA_ORIENTATION=-
MSAPSSTPDAAAASTANIQNPLASTPSSLRWVQAFELGYNEAPKTVEPSCFHCGKHESENAKLSKCSKCQTAKYCSRDCQVNDWKDGRHKLVCKSYQRLNDDFDNNADAKAAVRAELYARIRFYACPYAVHKTTQLGKGFLFVQSNMSLRDLSIPIPKDVTGVAMPRRSILMHFLTLGEYDSEVCRDDFEMAEARTKLSQIVEEYDEEKEVVLLYRMRCGHVAVGRAVLVPDYGICKQLGRDYYDSNNSAGAVQLNLDEM